MKHPISLQLYSVRDTAKDDFYGVLKRVAEYGYKGVEFAGLHGKDPKEVRKVLDDLGLVASSTHGPVPNAENLSEVVDAAKTLGYDMVIAGRGRDQFKTVDQIKAVAADFQAGAELLKEHGLRMGYHNHWWEFNEVDGRLGYEILMELAPDMFSQMDTYWASNFGAVDVPAMVAKYKDRLPNLHIKDGPLVEGEPHTAVGAGKMDVPAVVNAADPDVLEWLVVELDACATDMHQAVKESCQYLVESGLGVGR